MLSEHQAQSWGRRNAEGYLFRAILQKVCKSTFKFRGIVKVEHASQDAPAIVSLRVYAISVWTKVMTYPSSIATYPESRVQLGYLPVARKCLQFMGNERFYSLPQEIRKSWVVMILSFSLFLYMKQYDSASSYPSFSVS